MFTRVGTPFDKHAVSLIATMVAMKLIGLQQLIAWADSWVMKLDDSPLWLLELCTVPDVDTACELLMTTPDRPSTPNEMDANAENHLAALFLRYRNGTLSWADYLMEGGMYLDGALGGPPCEEYFFLLNVLRSQEPPDDMERLQSAEIEEDLQQALERVEAAHHRFEVDQLPG